MAKETMPPWQQVILTALRYVPKAKDGHDAWQKLNPEEQAAMMDYLGEHSGHDLEQAQKMLDGTVVMVKSRKRVWLWVLIFVLIAAATALWVCWLFEKHVGDLSDYAIILLCLSRLEQAWNVTPYRRMAQVWTEHLSNRDGTTSALKEMERIWFLPKRELRSKTELVLYSVALAIVLTLTFVSP